MTGLTATLFGTHREESARLIFIAVVLSIVIFSVNTFFTQVDLSMAPSSYIFVVITMLFVAFSAFRNNGFVISLLIAWILIVASVASGSFGGFHGDLTLVERYVTGPAILGLGLALPIGSIGYILGIVARIPKKKR